MTATKHPDQALPTNAPSVTKEYTPNIGETETREWRGERTDVLAKYDLLKTGADTGTEFDGNITGLTFASDAGRSRCMLRLERNFELNVYGQNVKLVEELYAIDVIKDLRTAPYFSTAAATKLTDDEVSAVMEAVEKQQLESEISNWAGWSNSQKELRYHLLHGVESYFETAFVLRRSLVGVITSAIQASFENINTVVTAPEFQSRMDDLIESLPSGEWLYKPPQAEHLGKGRWRITQEWQWATKWSKVYGGTWGL